MSATPPARRRSNPAVTVRRAQSERRYLSPWQVPSRFCIPGGRHGWSRVEHHHYAPRTAFIPLAYSRPHPPRMLGQSQMLLGAGSQPWGSMRHRPLPPISHVHLPPIALGSPPLSPSTLAIGAPPGVMPTMTLEERLSQERVTAFLAGETLPHQPRSILSCPESPLYESLISYFSEGEDILTIPDTEGEHEYQQIEVVDTMPKSDKKAQGAASALCQEFGSTEAESDSTDCKPPQEDHQQEQQQRQQITTANKLHTLDVKPERHHNKETEVSDDVTCSCQTSGSVSPKSDNDSGSSSPPPKTATKSSTQSLSSHESHKSAIYIIHDSSSSQEDNTSAITVSDTYNEMNRPPTVIHISSSSKCSVDQISPHGSEKNVSRRTSVKNNNLNVSTNQSSSSSSKSNIKTTCSAKSSSVEPAYTAQVITRTKLPEVTYPPLTIELPETKQTPCRPEQTTCTTKNKSTQASLDSAPHIITTLDPPIKTARPPSRPYKSSYNFATATQYSEDPPPLVVNFDSEHSDSDDVGGGTDSETDSIASTFNDRNSFYMTEGDTSSIYSSIAEIYSVLSTDQDSLVYVYRRPPDSNNHHSTYSTLSYRFPSYVLARGGSSGGSSGGGSSGESDSSWGGGSISFVEPSYRPSNLSVGARGHLKIDYSWSWDRLDDFVRATSPRGSSSDDQRSARGPRSPPGVTTGFKARPEGWFSLWEKYSDPVAG
nr:uncharacterized protein LOC128695917 [Cherax quadricarinatus]